MPKYYSEVTHEIVDYPEEAAALFPSLKPVPSEKSKTSKTDDVTIEVELPSDNKKTGSTNAK